jgi:hypothetical protein
LVNQGFLEEGMEEVAIFVPFFVEECWLYRRVLWQAISILNALFK